MAELSKGKDTTNGHWEMMGVITERPFPTCPQRVSSECDQRVREMYSGARFWATKPLRGPIIIKALGESTFGPASRLSTHPPTASFR